MNEDFRNIDDLFRSALENNEETPSPAVKESLDALLNKQEAQSYKKRYTAWKRTAILLLLLLTGFILYEAGIPKNGSGHSKENVLTKNSGTPGIQEHPESTNQNHFIPGKTKNSETDAAANNEVTNKEEDTLNNAMSPNGYSIKKRVHKEVAGNHLDTAAITKNQPGLKKITGQNTGLPYRKDKTAGDHNQAGIAIPNLKHVKNFNSRLKNNERWSKQGIMLVAPIEKFSAGKMGGQLINNIRPVRIPAISESIIKNSVAKNEKRSKAGNFKPYWIITGAASYDQVNYKLDNDMPDVIENIRHREVHEPSFSGGILAAWQLKKHWWLQTGLTYSNTAIGISPQKLYAFEDPARGVAYKYITSSGYAYIKLGLGAPPAVGDSLTTAEAKHTLQFVSVPLVLKYAIGKNKFTFRPGVGIEANFLASAKVEVEIEVVPNREIVFINKLSGARSFYWSFATDAELQYSVNKKLSLSLRPAFRYALSPITKNNVVETFPYSFGWGIGMAYKF